MDEARFEALLAYCRLDDLPEADAALLISMWEAAKAYMGEAGVQDPAENTARRRQFDLCVNAMVLSAWDSRGAFAVGGNVSDNPALRRMITQLKLTEPPAAPAFGAEGA